MKYNQKKVFEKFDRAYASNNQGRMTFEPDCRIVIFSDHHRGARNSADDFKRCERAYNEALDRYYESGYTLVLLGDVEDLWESWPGRTTNAYPATLQREARFRLADRYFRVYGNHDADWKNDCLARRFLKTGSLEKPIHAYESLLFHIRDGNGGAYKIFLTHGDQGTLMGDTLKWIMEPVVRYIWRTLQRMFKWSFNTPARDLEMRNAHDISMLRWAEQKCKSNDKLVLIAGHTHDPVFSQPAPCYYNSGCRCYKPETGANSITGIEIAGGNIEMVKWTEQNGSAAKARLGSRPLTDIFAKL